MTGYAYLGTCWPAQADALAAHCAGSYPISVGDGSMLSCVGTTSSGLSLVRSDGTGAGSPFTVGTAYAACDTADISMAVPTPDMLATAWSYGLSGVLICYLVAWSCARVLEQIKN